MRRTVKVEDLRLFMRAGGQTLHGIPLWISPAHAYETREVDGGYQIFHYFCPMAHLHRAYDGRQKYICHPSKRNDLESEIRRN